MIQTFEDAETVLAQALPGYAARPQQQRLAQSVEGLFGTISSVKEGADIRHLMAQAGCGVGKSLGALIPAILPGTSGKRKRIIYATATKALQEQIAGKDLPFLQEHLPIAFNWRLLKGKSNYVCQAKLAEMTDDQLSVEIIGDLRAELSDPKTHSGDFEHLTTALPADKQYLLSTSTEECPGRKSCPFGDTCFAEKAKREALDADIVVTNTAMLMIDVKVRIDTNDQADILGEYDSVIIDEAHELPEIAQGMMAQQLRLKGLENLLSQTDGFLHSLGGKDMNEQIWTMKNAATEIFAYLETLLHQGTESTLALRLNGLEPQLDNFIELIEGMEHLEKVVMDVQTIEKRDQGRQARLSGRLLGMSSHLREFLTARENMIRWVEEEQQRRGKVIVLKWSPVDVGPFLNQGLWNRVPVVMVSATLAVGGNFSYMMETMGLRPSSVVSMDVGTPFDYSTQGRMFLPDRSWPNPSGNDKTAWTTRAQATTRELVRTSGGGALLLFTSRKAMQDAYKSLSIQFRGDGLTCLMQGDGRTNKELAEIFSTDTHSVLFALKSFFTGVDFQGEACRLVVVDKMPFAVPTDVIFAARKELINRRAKADVAFSRLAVPMMTLTLIQATGRLIRSVTDRGVVAILDPRLTTTGYGKGIVRTLPRMPVVDTIEKVAEFYSAA